MSENGRFGVRFFIGGVILQYPNVLPFAGAMIFLGFFTDHLDLPPGTPLSPFRIPQNHTYCIPL